MTVDVAGLIAGAESRANSLANQAQSALSAAASAIGFVDPGNMAQLQIPALEQMPAIPQAPQLADIQVAALPAQPVKPTVQDIVLSVNSQLPTPPTDLGNLVVTEPVRPSSLPSFGKSAPQVQTTFTLPDVPDRFTGQAPTMSEIVIPNAPSIVVPKFDGVKPADLEASPDVTQVMDREFRNASPMMMRMAEGEVDVFLRQINPRYAEQLDRLESKLAEYLSGDTATGLKPEVEQRIYDRSQSRQDAEARRMEREAASRFARAGFTMPPGALQSAVLGVRQSAADNNANSSREIVVMQAQMEQQNIQFALNLSANIRQSVVQARIAYHGNMIQVMGQAINFAQATLNGIVQSYDMAVRAYTAKLDGYRADAVVFEALVRASLTEIEVFKAQVDAEQAKVQVDQARVAVFRAQIDAHQSAVDTYGKQIQAIVQLASLEKLKLEAFQTEVQAFASEVQAAKFEWDAYSSAWSGEESKVRAALAKAQLYTAQVDGYRAALQAESTRIDALGRSNQSNLSAFEAEVRAWGAQAQANAQVVSSKINAQESMVRAYQVNSQAVISAANAAAEGYRARAGVEIEKAKMQNQYNISWSQVVSNQFKVNADQLLAVGTTYAGMAQAALSGVTSLVSAQQE